MPTPFGPRPNDSGFARILQLALMTCWLLLALATPSRADDSPAATLPEVQTLRSAQVVAGGGTTFPAIAATRTVQLPDEWWMSRPKEDGPVWYRLRFATPVDKSILMAAYIERVCSNAEVYLNGAAIFAGGRMEEPVTRNCHYPQLVTLPAGLLRAEGNELDIKVQGYALQRVAGRQRAGGMSTVQVGPYETLASLQAEQLFWNVSLVKTMTVALVVLGLYMLYLGWLNRQDAHFSYFGVLTLAWAAVSARLWWPTFPFDNATVEFLSCIGFAVIVGAAVQFLLSYAGLRSRTLEIVLLLQIIGLPLTLALAGPARLFVVSSAWYMLMAFEVIATMALYLYVTRKARPMQFRFMGAVLTGVALLMLMELAVQYELLPMPSVPLLPVLMPLMFMLVGARQLRGFGRALQASEADRMSLESRINEVTAEIERNFAQMAELRVEQVTEKERKRIAADLHDDLGAKLLTIVHTSESERISTLAREALEEMRLSVRGLTGRAMQVADALADWRAETVLRLGQANIEADWKGPTDEVVQQFSARAFVQTTRILREAVSNIIKHSGASHCKVRCSIDEHQFILVVQDNGKGIPMELDGKLDRGHGMASMKHRAKQMQGQCLVESGPGYGTVIRLTLPL
jgi:two-component system sensor histidine kinase UhpB